MMAGGDTVRVFCSYAHDDLEFVDGLSRQVKALEGIHYCDDRDITAGDRWQDTLREGIDPADIIIFLLSGSWFESPDCEKEFNAARAREKDGARIIPFIARPVPYRGTHFSGYEPRPVVQKRPTAVELLDHPEAEYARFAEEIFDLADEIRGRRKARTVRPAERRLFGIPLKAEHFVGRRALVDTLAQRLRAPEGIVSLCGPTGFGKTALAAEYIRRHRDEYDLVAWLRVDRLARDLTELAHELDLPATSEESARLALKAWLQLHDRWLLVLDNASKPGELDGLLREQHGGHVIVTSKSPGWDFAGTKLHVDELELADAVSYLLETTGSYDDAAATRLAERLECVPIRLVAAARKIAADGISLDAYLGRISDEPDPP